MKDKIFDSKILVTNLESKEIFFNIIKHKIHHLNESEFKNIQDEHYKETER